MKTPEEFMEYFRSNYPGPSTIIARPDWHAPKIYAAAIHATIIDMLLFCPTCQMQHIDQAEEGWINPPHKSHLCRKQHGGCGTIWRPADVATNGVRAINTSGSDDTWRMTRHEN